MWLGIRIANKSARLLFYEFEFTRILCTLTKSFSISDDYIIDLVAISGGSQAYCADKWLQVRKFVRYKNSEVITGIVPTTNSRLPLLVF